MTPGCIPMSRWSPMTKPVHNQPAEDADTTQSFRRLRTLPRLIVQPLQFVSFWIAIALPFLHVPLLMTGVSSIDQVIAVAGLVGANLVAIALGHSYQPGAARAARPSRKQ